MPIRILRLLEYEFPDFKAAESHLSRLGVPLNGTKEIPQYDSATPYKMIIRSTAITTHFEHEPPAEIPSEQEPWFAAGLEKDANKPARSVMDVVRETLPGSDVDEIESRLRKEGLTVADGVQGMRRGE